MKQRISVRAMIKREEKILLLRRSSGRESIIGDYELPGGLIDYAEQPEEALARHLQEDIGLIIQTAQLDRVVSYIDQDDREIHYVSIIYAVSVMPFSKVSLRQNYDHYIWESESEIQQDTLSVSTKLMLSKAQLHLTPVKEPQIDADDIITTSATSHLIIYSDGGSRGNPGPSASGCIIMNQYEQVIHEDGMYLGITTNNQAEYHGVRLGLEKAKELGAKTIDFRIDSMLVVNQMNGLYKIKNRELWPIHDRIRELVKEFDRVSFTHVRREYNQLADGMVNKILNAHAQDKV